MQTTPSRFPVSVAALHAPGFSESLEKISITFTVQGHSPIMRIFRSTGLHRKSIAPINGNVRAVFVASCGIVAPQARGLRLIADQPRLSDL
jgi:hypothetical protein